MKQRWITFHEWGGDIVKEEPKDGSFIVCPSYPPLHIPMHYWKLDGGTIVEMNVEEKLISDRACNETAQPRPAQSGLLLEPIEEGEILDLNDVLFPIQQNLFNLEYKTKSLGDNHEKDIQHLQHRISKVGLKVNNLISDGDARNNNILHHIKELDKSQESLAGMIGSLDNTNDVAHQQIKDLIYEQSDALQDQEAQNAAHLEDTEKRLDHLEKHPKVEKFYIINNFHIKEYIQIVVTSSIVFIILKLLIK